MQAVGEDDLTPWQVELGQRCVVEGRPTPAQLVEGKMGQGTSKEQRPLSWGAEGITVPVLILSFSQDSAHLSSPGQVMILPSMVSQALQTRWKGAECT